MTQDRRNPSTPFDETMIQPFLRDRGVRSVELLQAGKINTNYKIELTDGLECVLRLYSHGDPAREAYVMSLGCAISYPCPWNWIEEKAGRSSSFSTACFSKKRPSTWAGLPRRWPESAPSSSKRRA